MKAKLKKLLHEFEKNKKPGAKYEDVSPFQHEKEKLAYLLAMLSEMADAYALDYQFIHKIELMHKERMGSTEVHRQNYAIKKHNWDLFF